MKTTSGDSNPGEGMPVEPGSIPESCADRGRMVSGPDPARREPPSLRADGATKQGGAGGDETTCCPEGIPFAGLAEAVGAGRYQTEGEYKRGAMGVIYKCFDSHLGREVAIKFLLKEHKQNAALRTQFLQEARITARLQHPGVVPVYELHEGPGDDLFFTMKFVHGRTLKELLAGRTYRFHDLPRFLNVFEKVCQTMAYAHSLGVIHRDLKPSNIMVGRFGVVRVMDWGLAEILPGGKGGAAFPGPAKEGESNPMPWLGGGRGDGGEPGLRWEYGRVMGTLAYMAPEQANGQIDQFGKAADVFGLGAILCEILTGEPVYAGRDLEEIYHKAVRADLGDARTRLDKCLADPQLVSLAKHCLDENPDRRPQDAGAVAHAVTAQIESDLKRSALDMVRFFELSPDMFCLASLDGYFQRVNDNFTRVLGFSKSELVSRPFLDFVHPEDLPQTLAQIEKLSLGLPVVRFKNRYRDVQRNYHWFEWTAKAIPEEGVIFAIARTEENWFEG